jgi:integrase
MPRKSDTDNVRKLCHCAKWKQCAHPWYVDFQTGRRRYRPNLDKLIGRHALDFPEAKAEARRAIVAWQDGRTAADLLPCDRPTVAALLEAYPRAMRRHVAACTAQAKPIGRTVVNGRAFGAWHADEITREMLEAFRLKRPRVAANRDLGLLRAAFNWAVLGGLVPATPFKVGTVAAVKLAREEGRARRLQGDEGDRLARAAGGLSDVITGALETGCRRGELLSLQWHQVRFAPRAELFLVAEKTKTKRDRRIPMSTVLGVVLKRRRLDPAGAVLPPEAYVFGDDVGRRRRSMQTAWEGVLKRANITGLHFHDLRREAGSRWMDAGIPLATIQRWLGHANISQTSTYLGASLGADEQDMRAFEERIGRLTHVDVLGGSERAQGPGSDQTIDETPQSNGVVH